MGKQEDEKFDKMSHLALVKSKLRTFGLCAGNMMKRKMGDVRMEAMDLSMEDGGVWILAMPGVFVCNRGRRERSGSTGGCNVG